MTTRSAHKLRRLVARIKVLFREPSELEQDPKKLDRLCDLLVEYWAGRFNLGPEEKADLRRRTTGPALLTLLKSPFEPLRLPVLVERGRAREVERQQRRGEWAAGLFDSYKADPRWDGLPRPTLRDCQRAIESAEKAAFVRAQRTRVPDVYDKFLAYFIPRALGEHPEGGRPRKVDPRILAGQFPATVNLFEVMRADLEAACAAVPASSRPTTRARAIRKMGADFAAVFRNDERLGTERRRKAARSEFEKLLGHSRNAESAAASLVAFLESVTTRTVRRAVTVLVRRERQ